MPGLLGPMRLGPHLLLFVTWWHLPAKTLRDIADFVHKKLCVLMYGVLKNYPKSPDPSPLAFIFDLSQGYLFGESVLGNVKNANLKA